MQQIAEERAKQLTKAERLITIGQTAGMVGHDIRNPLQSIIGEIYLLKGYLQSTPESETKREAVESLESIETNVNYINKIVADLQDYSRTIKPEHLNFNLKDLVSDVLQTISRQKNLLVNVNVIKTTGQRFLFAYLGSWITEDTSTKTISKKIGA